MATSFDGGAAERTGRSGFAKRVSTHLALALMLFCLLQILVVARMGGSLILHLCVIIATGGFAIAARNLERRWDLRDRSGLARAELELRYRRDICLLWGVSLFGALLWVPVAILLRALFR